MSEKLKRFTKEHSLVILLVPFVVLTQLLILSKHLGYGFSDVDWGFLSFYRIYKQKYPNPIINLVSTFRDWGVYAHQSYYIGLQGEFFGLNFKPYQLTTHIFKIIATLTTYPIFYVLAGNGLVAVLSVILFSFAYPAVGTMYTVVTSSDYLAVFSMNIFLLLYWFVVKNSKISLRWLLPTLLVLLTTLFLSTERMYPLLFMIPLIEVLVYWKNQTRENLKTIFKRIVVFYTLAALVFLYEPVIFTNFLTRNGGEILRRLVSGDWHVLLTPFISLGSMLLPHNYWRYLGTLTLGSFSDYLSYFTTTPLLIFFVATMFISYIISRSPFKFTIRTVFLTALLGILGYFLASHQKTHFDITFMSPAFIGFYLLAFSWSSFREWMDTGDRLLIGLFAGPILAFIYIFLTWIASDTFLIFTGPHRYLTVPAIGTSFFVASLLYLIYKKLISSSRIVLKALSFLPFVLLIPLSLVWIKQIDSFFADQLNHGFGAKDQQHMRSQLAKHTKKLSSTKPSLFYFDYSEDTKNGYYYDNTIFGGFKTWMLFHESINLNKKLEPTLLFYPPSGKEILENSVVTENGSPVGFVVEDKFFSTDNFYAFVLKDKKLIGTKEETLTKLGF